MTIRKAGFFWGDFEPLLAIVTALDNGHITLHQIEF
jgi:hypothetical protein